MTAYDAPVPPVPPAPYRFLSLLIDHNPFYLLSAMFMLFGVFMVNNAQAMRPGDLTKLLILLAILNLYEFLVITLGRLLVWKPTVPRDGMALLTLEALFFADVTFLNAETVMTRFALGTIINIALLLLAIFKSGLILKTMRIKVTAPLLAFLSLQLAVLFLLPVALKWHAASDRSVDLVLYAAWWFAGLMPLAFDLLCRAFPAQMTASIPSGKARALRLVYVILPFISLVAHIGFMHWVYKADFYIAEIAPILLGLTIALLRLPFPAHTLFWRFLLPIAALAVSLQNPAALHIEFIKDFPAFTPLRAAMAATYVTLAYVFFMGYILQFLAGGLILVAIAIFGPSLATLIKLADDFLAFVKRLIPSTPTAWGILSIISSFALLALGALVSWITHRNRETDTPAANPHDTLV